MVCARRYLRLIKINMSDILAHDIHPTLSSATGTEFCRDGLAF